MNETQCEGCRKCVTPFCPECGKKQGTNILLRKLVTYLDHNSKRAFKDFKDPNESGINPGQVGQRKRRIEQHALWRQWADALAALLDKEVEK